MAGGKVDYVALASEINTDPATVGYAALKAALNDQGLADALNLARASVTIRRADIAPQALWEAIDVADLTALPGTPTAAQLSTERRQLAWLTGLAALPTVRLLNDDGTDTMIRKNLLAMFTAGSGTLTRLAALSVRQGSRAEFLFGAAAVVTNIDVARALGRGA
jgi:hypothetical protein